MKEGNARESFTYRRFHFLVKVKKVTRLYPCGDTFAGRFWDEERRGRPALQEIGQFLPKKFKRVTVTVEFLTELGLSLCSTARARLPTDLSSRLFVFRLLFRRAGL